MSSSSSNVLTNEFKKLSTFNLGDHLVIVMCGENLMLVQIPHL
jgi:hypothetical protein